MNPWDIDPNLYLPIYRAIFRMLRRPLRDFLVQRQARAMRPAGCRG
jgi:hypothetical protein